MVKRSKIGLTHLPTKKRGTFEIFLSILSATKNESKPTRIMYLTNLSYVRMSSFLRNMINQGLIKRDGTERKIYSLTEKGQRVLELYKDMEIDLGRLD